MRFGETWCCPWKELLKWPCLGSVLTGPRAELSILSILRSRVTKWTLIIGYLWTLQTCWRQDNNLETPWCLSTVGGASVRATAQNNLSDHSSTDSTPWSDFWHQNFTPWIEFRDFWNQSSRFLGDPGHTGTEARCYIDLWGHWAGELLSKLPLVLQQPEASGVVCLFKAYFPKQINCF